MEFSIRLNLEQRVLLPVFLHWACTVNFLTAAHHLAWTQHPAIWLCESCAVLWLVLRKVQSPWIQTGVLSMLCGLMLNALVTDANAGTMPVVGMPSTVHPISSLWRAATSNTRLPFLADQARLGLFSLGDIALIFGGLIVVMTCLRRTLKTDQESRDEGDCSRPTSWLGGESAEHETPLPPDSYVFPNTLNWQRTEAFSHYS
jgi:hypothetical protein